MEHVNKGTKLAEDSPRAPDDSNLLRVASESSATHLAAAISHAIYDNNFPVLRAIGAGAVNQAVKAIAIARGYVATRGIDLMCIPGFETVTMKEGAEVSAITMRVLRRQ